MDNNFYLNDTNHHGFIYQNPIYSVNEPSQPRFARQTDLHDSKFEQFKLATIYVKPQVYNGISSPADALRQGTAFKELYRPFIGKGGQR